MKNNVLASVVAYAEAIKWNMTVLGDSTDAFICPSNFLKENMKKGGFEPGKLKVISNFILDEKLEDLHTGKGNYYCYVGRLSSEKGLVTLLEAASALPQFELRIIGTGPLEEELKEKFTAGNIKFEGFRKWPELKDLLGFSRFMVMPSECYENNPLSVIESLCLGTPVVGARIGGIPELIEEGINGHTFISGNVEDLRNKISLMFDNTSAFDYPTIAESARKNYNSGRYYYEIMKVYEENINFNKR